MHNTSVEIYTIPNLEVHMLLVFVGISKFIYNFGHWIESRSCLKWLAIMNKKIIIIQVS